MTVYPPGWEDQHGVQPSPGGSHEFDVFTRVEGLAGEEEALLKIPAAERDAGQRDRLHVLGEELDRIWERLRRRSERLGDERPEPA
jgi:hypothetical protein